MKVLVMILVLLSISALAEESPRDNLVKNAQRVEKGVLKDLGSLREKGCKLLKNKKCIEDRKEDDEQENEKSK